jgi:hypothetical protein
MKLLTGILLCAAMAVAAAAAQQESPNPTASSGA